MLLGYVYKLRPNQEQSRKIDRWLDMLRASYNWYLADRIDTYYARYIQGEYCDLRTKATITPLACSMGCASGEPWRENGKKRSAVEIQITTLPYLKKARPWYKGIDSTVLQQNLKRLEQSFQNFFSGRGFPKFKSRSNFRSFTFATGVKLSGNKIYFPKLGWMRYFNSRPLPEGFKIKSVTIRKKANGYYVSVRIEDQSIPSFPILKPEEVKTVTGLDLGLGQLTYCSDRSAIPNPKFATNSQTKRLQRIRQRRVSRKKKRSKNRGKAQKKLSRFQHRIAVKREAYQWQVAQKIVKKSDAIAIEDLNIKGMMKRCKPKYDENKGRFLPNGQSAKRALSRLIADASWYSLTQKIEYMAAKSGKIVLRVDPKYTSQECSVCHHIDSANREGEKFLCTQCGHVDDANFQAGFNIKQKAIQQYQLTIQKHNSGHKKCVQKADERGLGGFPHERLVQEKVRGDSPKPKQLSLFETPSSELTEGKRRKHYARKSKRNVPRNLGEQLSLFNQDNNPRTSATL